ncbi:hypothetical protein DFH09DRAFT_1080866 [Mycena vulgaris]|nr:hypothetical protein DFH09DRAFT_1080866 [Mycena vulgaris]
MFPYQYPQGGQSAQYAQYAQYTQMQQIQEARMQQAQMRHIQQHQGTSTHPSLALPPLAPNPSTQGYAGTTIHICANHNGRCLKCRMSHNDPLAVSQASDGSSIRHITINALYATRYRSKSLKTPSEFTNKLGIFDFIVQMSTLPKDKTTWLYNRVGVIGVMSHLRNHHTVVRKSSGPSMVMRRVDIPGPGYVVEFVLQSTPGHGDIGYYGWYRYHDGSIRVRPKLERGGVPIGRMEGPPRHALADS